jgi:superfamily II DNA/RNA helicase
VSIFDFRDCVIKTYKDYVSSFLNISDFRVRGFVEDHLVSKGFLWPDPLIQLNLPYKQSDTVEDLCQKGFPHPDCAQIFKRPDGETIRLYVHQQEAILKGLRKEHFVVTSGTGSGKTLTYFIPVFNAVLSDPIPRVKAIVVYPMNALVNSQFKALEELAERYKGSTGKDMPVTFARYTGQENRETKDKIQKNPPHILLTNYVMLELMLLRPEERNFVDRTATGLEFLVLDELHTYRGRQGADVAMLIRRLREKCGNPNLVCIGTSATMLSGSNSSREERHKAVAEVAGKIFGVMVNPDNVVGEVLEPVLAGKVGFTPETLRAALETPVPDSPEEILQSPLTAWIEETFGVEKRPDGLFVRRPPITLEDGIAKLSEETGLPKETCGNGLKELLTKGSQIRLPDGNPLFAFKLHQFISQGQSVYATLEEAEKRLFSMEGEYYIRNGETLKVLCPLSFCRVCGQDYYEVVWDKDEGKILPYNRWEETAEEERYIPGYLMLAFANEDWSYEDIPPEWCDNKGRIKKEYRPHVPRDLWVAPDGSVSEDSVEGASRMWFQPRPFLLCQRCGEFYTRRDKNDFKKLAHLSSEGRSSVTTILCTSVIQHASNNGVGENFQKILSFTDNRQDASLQAGHFNDFVQVSLLRAGLYSALEKNKTLTHDNISFEVVKAMGVDLAEVASNPGLDPTSDMGKKVLNTFRDLIEYRLYEDLQRGWRVVQPNLEECGLMKVEYDGLEALVQKDDLWRDLPWIYDLPQERRKFLLKAFLDHLRKKLSIKVGCLEEQKQQQLLKRISQDISEKWKPEEERGMRRARFFQIPGDSSNPNWPKLSKRSVLGRFFSRQLGLSSEDEYNEFILKLIDVLHTQGLLWKGKEWSGNYIQLPASALLWTLGEGTPPSPDPIYSKAVESQVYIEREREANRFFVEFYKTSATKLKGLEGREHTAQISYSKRTEREERFRKGDLKCLFCSPTMELGIDIADLQVVHLRNIPPTPANYAQRSGRAGRRGDPALVLAYCLANSGHDQYFFKHREQMVAGAVQAPRLDLGNEELIKAHIHSMWLSKVGISLGSSVKDILELDLQGYPLKDSVKSQIQLSKTRLSVCIQEAKDILKSCGPDLEEQGWYSEDWLEEVILRAPEEFDRAFDRWRELYLAAMTQLKEATGLVLSTDREKQEEAKRRIEEANRQRNLLLNEHTSKEESDFYPYRYLASEGFLPGYNFPRLPVRAFIPKGDGEYLSRPRFLAISEFGPHNIIYHDGAKYEVTGVVAPPGGLEERRILAKVCDSCGFFHERVDVDTCENCGITLNSANSEVVPLLDMPNVKTWRRERITCDEEDRIRYGYNITTHFRFAPAPGGKHRTSETLVYHQENDPILRLVYAPSAFLYRVNHGWKRSREKGFLLNPKTGLWEKKGLGGKEDPQEYDPREVTPVCLYVRDTQNMLLVQPLLPDWRDDSILLTSLQYALHRGMEIAYQIEESELASELIGEGDHRAILFWEATEGGVGVLKRLLEDRDAIARIAQEALDRLHFDTDTLEDLQPDECPCACYECLLSYSNQYHHSLLDRHKAKEPLSILLDSTVQPQKEGRSYEEHYRWLRSLTDSRSDLERKFIDHLYKTKCRLPDDAQKKLEDLYSIPDFFYEPHICVFCDGSVHDTSEQKEKDRQIRNQLKEKGYRVVVIRYDKDLEEQVSKYPDVFGEALS